MTDTRDPDDVVDPPDPQPETAAADRDDDRLATELFRRYGSVQRGRWRGREHWEADATAVRTILASDAAMLRIVEQLAAAQVRVSSDPEAHMWNQGFDEAWQQKTPPLWVMVLGLLAGAYAYVILAVARWIVGGRR